MRISGTSAVVVGGAGGLGEATVRRLHAAGAKVVIADLAGELGVRYARTDATNTDDVSAKVDQDAAAPNVTPARPSAPNATLA